MNSETFVFYDIIFSGLELVSLNQDM